MLELGEADLPHPRRRPEPAAPRGRGARRAVDAAGPTDHLRSAQDAARGIRGERTMRELHPTSEELELYVIGAHDAIESAAIERHVSDCETCARDLREHA